MISRLRGLLLLKKPPMLLIEVGGLGYEVQAPMSTVYVLPPVGSEVILNTHFHVREEGQVLYAFAQESERHLFRALIKVSGVGPKMALAILSGMSVSQFMHCVAHRLVDNLVRVPGVGRKTAERLIVELSGKLGLEFMGEDMPPLLSDDQQAVSNHQLGHVHTDSPAEEAIAALIALGYKPQEALRTIRAMRLEPEAQTEDFIRRALQQLASA